MKKIFTLGGIGSIASIVALIFFLYYQFIAVESVSLEIKTINEEELTEIPQIEGFKGSFTFKDSIVSNLWKVRFSIENNGNKTLIGKGDNKDILDDTLSLFLGGDFKVISLEQRGSNFPVDLKRIDYRNFHLDFKQWRPSEFVELTAYIENEKRDNLPKFKIDERTIINGTVNNVDFNVAKEIVNDRLIDRFSKWVQNTLWWIAVVVYITVIIFLFIQESSKEDWNKKFIPTIIVTILILIPFLWMIRI